MRHFLRRVPVCVLLTGLAACGGGGGNRTITSGSPTAPTPGVNPGAACDALGATVPGAIPIVNGAECSSSRTAVVLLNARDAGGFAVGACSGTIISRRAILTAAHCLDGETALVRVWLGSGAEIPAQSFVLHPTYVANPSTGLDVGIVRMAEDLPREPVPILTGREAQVGETAVIAGWGRDQSSIPATLRAGSTAISAVNTFFLETLFSQTAAAICSGDSGGPLLISDNGRWAIAGISSAISVVQCNAGTNFYLRVRNGDVVSFITDAVPDVVRR